MIRKAKGRSGVSKLTNPLIYKLKQFLQIFSFFILLRRIGIWIYLKISLSALHPNQDYVDVFFLNNSLIFYILHFSLIKLIHYKLCFIQTFTLSFSIL